MRIQFTVNEVEWSKLKSLAESAEYPDVPSYCKDVVLENRNYQKLWKTVTDKISKMDKDTVFALRDIIDTPPANLGVKLFKNQKSLGIQNQKKDSSKSNTFKKL